MKQLDVNKYQMDDGVIITARERDFMTYDEGTRFIRIPLEKIVTGDGKFGTAVILGKYLNWSTKEPLSEQERDLIRQNIAAVSQYTGYQYECEP